MGCLNILHDSMDKISKDEIQELVNTSLSSGGHMIHLLNDILARSKNRHLSTSSIEDKEPYVEFAKSTVDGMRSIAANANLQFNLEITPKDTDCFLVVDRTKVTQVITNITNNAIKASPRHCLCSTVVAVVVSPILTRSTSLIFANHSLLLDRVLLAESMLIFLSRPL